MSDVRALLKAKRQEVHINHPLATYSQKTGQLRCTVCNMIIKHPSAWEGHLGSKSHRTNVTRIKEEERLKEVQRVQDGTVGFKRKAEEKSSSPESKRQKILEDGVTHPLASYPARTFPGDFFSDPSRVLLSRPLDISEDDTKAAPMTQAMSALDLDWEKFQRTVLNPPDERETYDRATIFAEPESASETPDGFPPQQPADITVDASNKIDEFVRRQKEQDERELIIDRLLDEERAQEEADMKVSMMKGKLETLKKKRAAAKAIKLTK